MTEHGFSLRQQIEELELEVRYRKKVFPNLVRKREMTQSLADYRIDDLAEAFGP